MKTLPQFLLNQFFNLLISATLLGSCFSAFAQTPPLDVPDNIKYPGIIETFEKLIQIDQEKYQNRLSFLIKNAGGLNDFQQAENLDLDPDFLNSIVLHSDSGYLKLAALSKCRFYEAILADLLKTSQGQIKKIPLTFTDNGNRNYALIKKQDFLSKIVNKECPKTKNIVSHFQIKTLENTLKKINFKIPSGKEECKKIHRHWLRDAKTPFLCQIHEYLKSHRIEDLSTGELKKRKTLLSILENKISPFQKNYLESLCVNLDNEKQFCDDFLNISFWSKVAQGLESNIYAENICASNKLNPSRRDLLSCLKKINKENDFCLYPSGHDSSIKPLPRCELLSNALNFSSYKVKFNDCAGNSDNLLATNMGRIISHLSPNNSFKESPPCQAISAGFTYDFNKKFDNDENWNLQACYEDKLAGKEKCSRVILGTIDNLPESYPVVVANILKNTRGADQGLNCSMVSSDDYNPLLLKYKSGCHIIYKKNSCFINSCEHKIIFNDRPIDFIKIKGSAQLAYFPLSLKEERYSQHYLLTRDFKKDAKKMSTLSRMVNFLKKSSTGIIHGIGCAEDLLPTFFKSYSLNQCTSLPFIISGFIQEKDNVVFVTRTAADSLTAPRLLSWSVIFSGVKNYQNKHPLKTWAMYGLD